MIRRSLLASIYAVARGSKISHAWGKCHGLINVNAVINSIKTQYRPMFEPGNENSETRVSPSLIM